MGVPAGRNVALSSKRLDTLGVVVKTAGPARTHFAGFPSGNLLDLPRGLPFSKTATVVGSGARDAPVNRVVNAIGNVASTTEDRARTAGALLAEARSDATIDALVVAEAVGRGGGVILSGDVADLRALGARHSAVVIQSL